MAFLDTVGLLALLDPSDQWHADGDRAFVALSAARTRLITTRFVLLESGNAAAHRPYRLTVAKIRDEMEAAGTPIDPSEEDWREAWAAYRRGDADRAGIVDHVSFLVMRRHGVSDAFTNDHHFRAAGFQTLF